MRLARFNTVTEPVSRARTGAVVSDGVIGDLRAGYARFLVEQQGDIQGREIAALRIPADVRHILHVGKPALSAIEHTVAALSAAYARNPDALGLDGEPLFTLAPNARLHNPLKPGRIVVASETGVEEWAAGSVMGPVRDVPLPSCIESLSYCAGLGIVIGRACRAVAEREALTYIGGFTVANTVVGDASREFGDSTVHPAPVPPFRRCIIGPHLVTPGEVPEPEALGITTRLNGREIAWGSAAAIAGSIARLVARVSLYGLEPGDLIVVADAARSERGLRAGDVLETDVQGLGLLRNKVVAET